MCGGVLLSRTLAGAVPLALEGLASGFGMGPGVSRSAVAAVTCGVVVGGPLFGSCIVVVGVASPRPISTGQLSTLRCVHVRPINPVVCWGP